VGFGNELLESVAPGASYSLTSGTTASAASKGCSGFGTVVVVVDVVVVVVVGGAAVAVFDSERGQLRAMTPTQATTATTTPITRRQRMR
jgi:hypothetical protein